MQPGDRIRRVPIERIAITGDDSCVHLWDARERYWSADHPWSVPLVLTLVPCSGYLVAMSGVILTGMEHPDGETVIRIGTALLFGLGIVSVAIGKYLGYRENRADDRGFLATIELPALSVGEVEMLLYDDRIGDAVHAALSYAADEPPRTGPLHTVSAVAAWSRCRTPATGRGPKAELLDWYHRERTPA